ncbi:type II secretion system protein N (GspN) [Rheinheimera pacifica]|uniref:Type II secretion system protein N n=1 Tax=Rheinheimera pacifica TaxID=173990 RepID=A0A1H6K1W6_9GAMM|nr:type II secretion system protein N [Rheinheimera pacifica]SEH65527.1 type II secretion system protein N (GspN) [Rheinheimera pacifica]
MSKTKLIVIGVTCYLVFTLLLTPASWWLKLAPLPAQLQLGTVSGTLWQGEIAGLRYQQLQFDSLQWSLSPWRLFTGKLQFELQSGSAQNPAQPYVKATASYGFGGGALQNSLLKLPVAQLVPMLPLPLPVDASGELVLDVAGFSQGQPWCKALTGHASWQDARLQTPTGTWLELQSLFGDLSCADGTIVLTTDGANRLGLDIKAVVNAEQLLVNGTLKPEADMPGEVHQAMQFLGKPDAQGRYRISF